MSGSISGAPKVTLTELDVSAGTRAPNGAYCAQVLVAPRGPVGVGILVTNEQDLVRRYTPDGATIRPEYDSGFFVAIENLKKTNKLWISRAVEQADIGGAFVRVAGAAAAGAPNSGAPAERGFQTVSRYDITSSDGRINPGPIVFTADGTPGNLTVLPAAYAALATGDVVQVSATGAGAVLPLPLAAATDYYVIKHADTPNKVSLAVNAMNASQGLAIIITSIGAGTFSLNCAAKSRTDVWTPDLAADTVTVTSGVYDLLVTGDTCKVDAVGSGTVPGGLAENTDYWIYKTPVTNKLKLATSMLNAQNGVGIDLTSTGTGTQLLVFGTITATTPGHDKAILFYGADPGAYNNALSFTLVNYATNPAKVKEPGAFLLQFYYDGVRLPQEGWLCSMDPAKKDGRNQSIYVVDVLARSSYVRAEVNPLLAPTTTVADVLTPIPFNGGSDGLAVTDSTMARALNVLNVPGKYPITFIQDGGWTTPAFQLQCIQLAETIGAAAAFVSVPYAVESTSNALNDVVAYYRNLGSGSSHAGIFSSHVQVIDRYNSRKLWIAPTGNVAAEYAYTFDQLAPGQPVGGRFADLSVIDVLRHWSDGEMDFLYDSNVNPIRFKGGSGIQIWGQKTLQSRPSDLDRLNARMLLMVISPALRDAYENYLFTRNSIDNDTGTRRALTLITDNYMQTIKARGGVYNWKTVCNDTNNTLVDVQNQTVNVWLLVQIVKAVEYIPFTIGVSPTNISLEIAQSLLATGNG